MIHGLGLAAGWSLAVNSCCQLIVLSVIMLTVMTDNSLLGYALLGLIHQRPLSGYDVKKIFASTPMAGFSDSPGAIYPALRRLERLGFVRGEVEQLGGLRRRRVFEITTKGAASLKAWQSRPIVEEDMVHHVAELLLRFAFMDETLGAERSLAFLEELARQLTLYIPTLREYLNAHASVMSTSGRLALESGIQEYEARLAWAKSSIAQYRRRRKR
jgi:DNA-binding PadR family transcriptional regulator